MAYVIEDAPQPSSGRFVIEDAPQGPVVDAMNKSALARTLDAGASLASGAVAGPVSGLAGIVGTLLPGKSGQGADFVQKTQDALTYQPRTEFGKAATEAVSYPFRKLAEAGDAAGAKTAEVTGSPSAGAAVNTAIQAAPLLLGRVSPKVPPVLRKPTEYDAGTMAAKDAGYTLPPTQANPSLLNQVVEGIAGKIKTAQGASIKNQPVTNGLVRKALGVPEDTPLNADTLNKVRSDAGAAYENIRGAGAVTADSAYSAALDAIEAPYKRAAADFPKAARSEVLKAVDGVRAASFDAGSAVDQIRILRNDADKAFRGGDKMLGNAYKGIAGALEEQLGRHLEAVGAPAEALDAFRQARQTIAQTYTVEKHLKSDGNVDAVGLARELKRKPLTGDLRTVAEFGEQFPKAAQKPERVGGVPAISALDAGAGFTAAAALHEPMSVIAALTARPLLRKLILSKLYQDAAVRPPSVGPSMTSSFRSLVGDAHSQPLLPVSEISQGQQQSPRLRALLGAP